MNTGTRRVTVNAPAASVVAAAVAGVPSHVSCTVVAAGNFCPVTVTSPWTGTTEGSTVMTAPNAPVAVRVPTAGCTAGSVDPYDIVSERGPLSVGVTTTVMVHVAVGCSTTFAHVSAVTAASVGCVPPGTAAGASVVGLSPTLATVST